MQVTVPEAARLLRVSEHTIRRRLRSGELQGSHVTSSGGFLWMVNIPDELLMSSPPSGETAITAVVIARLEAQIAAQETQIADKDKQIKAQEVELEARRREVQELHVLLQQAQAALPPPRDARPWWRRVWGRG